MACGRAHTLLSTDNGTVYSWGMYSVHDDAQKRLRFLALCMRERVYRASLRGATRSLVVKSTLPPSLPPSLSRSLALTRSHSCPLTLTHSLCLFQGGTSMGS